MYISSNFHQLQQQKFMMKTNQNELSKSPDHGSQPMKSYKNITSTMAFHLKSENDRGQQQHHRSPQMNRGQLRETFRRPRMPYNKLPQVFNQQKQKKKYGSKVKQDMIQNLGKLVENSEYKETQKYLQPLKPKQEKKQTKKQLENRNLFNPVQKMKRMIDKATQQLKQNHQLSVRSGPRISQCITLDVVKRGHNTGIIKKMLHVPTLSLVCVRQQPITQKQSRNLIRDWTKLWKQKLSGENTFVKIHQVLYNYPEGAISIFMEYFESRSLLNLLDLTATLPQSVIRQIFVELLKILQNFYKLTQVHFGGLSPSQIMFTSDNKIKISLGLFYHIPIPQSYSIYHIKASQKQNPFDFNNTITKFMKPAIQKTINLELQKSIDIFKLGLIALNCAIGNFQNYQQSSYIFDAIKYAFTQHGQKKIDLDNVCCLLHSEQYLIQLAFSTKQNQKTQRKPEQKYIHYMKLLKDRYSMHFINFLCQTLKLSHSKRIQYQELLAHSFVITPHDNQNKTVKIQLADLLALGRGWNQQVFYQSATLQKLDSFINSIRPVLEQCSRDTLNELIGTNQEKIYEVGKLVGLNSKTLGKKLQDTILEILKNYKQK